MFIVKISNEIARKTKGGDYLLQLGVPALMMPAIFLGAVLPFVLPAIKMAALVSGFINKSALLAAIMYAAKSAMGNDDNKIYYNSGYH